jgi:DNA-binding NtrC family response regulator
MALSERGLGPAWQERPDGVAPMSSRKVLLLDDEPGLTDVLEQYLRNERFGVLRAGDVSVGYKLVDRS